MPSDLANKIFQEHAAPASHFPTLGNWREAEFSLRRLVRRRNKVDKRAHAEAMFEVDHLKRQLEAVAVAIEEAVAREEELLPPACGNYLPPVRSAGG